MSKPTLRNLTKARNVSNVQLSDKTGQWRQVLRSHTLATMMNQGQRLKWVRQSFTYCIGVPTKLHHRGARPLAQPGGLRSTKLSPTLG
jgi:hypothetical protein